MIVTQAEHSRISGEIALLLGRFLACDVRRLAGAIALHDWPHFGGTHADVIEIGQKTAEQQRELVSRLSSRLPVDDFTELVIRMHWKRLTDESDIELRDAISESRIDKLTTDLQFTSSSAGRLDAWTDLCDALAFYISQGTESAGKAVLPDLVGECSWSFHWSVGVNLLNVHQVRVGGAEALVHRDAARDVCPLESEVSLMAYESDGYPQCLSPTMQSIRCRFGL